MSYKMLSNVESSGLGAFGPAGMRPLWGVAIGGGTSALTAILANHMGKGKVQMNADLIGFGAGLASAGVLYSMRRTRHAALGAVLGTVLASGLRWLERKLLGTVQLPAATAQVASQIAASQPGMQGALGIARTRALNGGLGLSTTRQLGIATTAQRSVPAGTIPGVAGMQLGSPGGGPPVSLMGPQSAAAAQVSLMGGPNVHGIAGHWGSTHFSKN